MVVARRDLRESVRSRWMIEGGHFDVGTESLARPLNSFVVGCNRDGIDLFREPGSLPDVLDHRFASDRREWLPGETSRPEASRKNGENGHVTILPESGPFGDC